MDQHEAQRADGNDLPEGPPAQRRRLVDRGSLEKIVQSELTNLFLDNNENRQERLRRVIKPKPPMCKPMYPLLLQHPWFMLRTLEYLSPCEIQKLLSTCKLLQTMGRMQKSKQILLQSIITSFSILSCHADLIFRQPEETRRRWMNLFCWLDDTMDNDRVHRALIAEQTMPLLCDDEEHPLFFRSLGRPETSVRMVIEAQRTATSRGDQSRSRRIPTAQRIRDCRGGCQVLHDDLSWWSFFAEDNEEFDNIRGYKLVLQAVDGHGGFLDVILRKGSKYYRAINSCGPLDPFTLPYDSLGHLLCGECYLLPDADQPVLDHQLCMLAWLVAHRFPPFNQAGVLARVSDLIGHAQELASCSWIESEYEDYYYGNVSWQTVAFLVDAHNGFFKLGNALAYI